VPIINLIIAGYLKCLGWWLDSTGKGAVLTTL